MSSRKLDCSFGQTERREVTTNRTGGGGMDDDDRVCDFSQSGYYAGDQVCPTDDLKDIDLKVVATDARVWLTLCPRHRLALLDKAFSKATSA